ATVTLADISTAADNIEVQATADLTWTSGGKSSTTDGVPLVLQVKKGDTIEIHNTSGVPHGFFTIDKKATERPSESKDFVLTCGEVQQSKPNAVLREIECEDKNRCECMRDPTLTHPCSPPLQSCFGVPIKDGIAGPEKGMLKLQVMDNFKGQVHFWCLVHRKIMWGTIELTP